MGESLDVVFAGGCGHVGLPFALSLADCGYTVGVDDIDAAKVALVKTGHVPFLENGAGALLKALLPSGRLQEASDPRQIERTDAVILVIGTLIDEFMNPSVPEFEKVLHDLVPNLKNGTLVVLRSTVFPATTEGPRLLKDTMQLSVYTPDQFPMGQAAMQINEGLPNYIVDTLDSRQSLQGRTVGILVMAFKGEFDNPRASLNYKLRKLAQFKGARVMCTDPFIVDTSFVPLEKVIEESDVLVIAAKHRPYRKLDLDRRDAVDIWGIAGPIRL